MAGAIASSVLCLAAGCWMLCNSGLKGGDDCVPTAIGLYFVGKAFFVGPLLIVTAFSTARTQEFEPDAG